jgi:hypothetical protein
MWGASWQFKVKFRDYPEPSIVTFSVEGTDGKDYEKKFRAIRKNYEGNGTFILEQKMLSCWE